MIVFPPGTAIGGQTVFRHARRGSNLGTYTVISKNAITAADISRRGVRLYSKEPG